jgi:tetratricopeptide (TPR) repeat protein
MSDTTNISGGVNFNDGQTSITGNVIGRDQNVYAAPDPLAQYFHQLPAAPSDFVGRAAEQHDLLNMIERGAVITGLRGMGGIGKTALGLVIAHQLRARYPDAQFFLDLRGAGDNPVTSLDALTHVVRAFYPTSKLPDNLADMQALYQTVLDGKRALVFFDNAKDAQQVMPLVPPASCLLLITSRAHFTLPGLKARDLNVLPPDQARELVLSIAAHIGECVDDIARLCGYLPQALRASASLLAETIDLDPCDYVRQLRDERQRLQLIGLDPARNLDMEASLNLSYAALSADEQRVLAHLSVFPADFDAEAEEAICEDADHTHLSRLVKLSLVQYNPHPNPLPFRERENAAAPLSPAGRGVGGEGRYSLHDLVRLFADGHLSADERAAVQYQHAEHYKNVLSAADDLYLQGNESIAQGLSLFDRDWINIQAGQQWVAVNAQDDAAAARLVNNYANNWYVLNIRLHPRENIRWLETALTAARQLQLRDYEGVHLGNLGIAYTNLGETRQAIEFYEQRLVIAREIGDRHGEANALSGLGISYGALGDARKQIEYEEQHRDITREIGDRRGEGNALGNLGLAYADLGETRKAIACYEQHRDIAREIGDRRGEGNALGNLGVAYADLGETRKAIEFHEQQLTITREIGDRRGEGNALGNLGIAYKNLGETRKAIEFYKQVLVIHREIGDRRGEGTALGNLGVAYADLGETQKAIEFYEQYRDIAREIGDRRGEGNALWNMAVALGELGEREQAIANAEAALKIYEAIEDPWAEKVRQQLAEWKA